MKSKTIFITILLMVLFSVIIYSETTSQIVEDTIADQTDTVGRWDGDHSLTNITDGNYTTYAVTKVNLTYAMINFSKQDGSGDLSKVQITYNTSSGSTGTNYTFRNFPKCWIGDNDKLLYRLASNFTQNFTDSVANETVRAVITNIINETALLLNGTAVPLVGRNIISNTVGVFNRTINISVINETNITNPDLIWKNNTNVTVLNTASVNALRVYNCSIREQIFNETNTSSNNLVWVNNTNMTLTNSYIVANSSIHLYNCSSPYTEIGRENFTFFPNGNLQVKSINTTPDGTVICANYTYQGLGLGEKLETAAYTLFPDGNIFMIKNDTFPDEFGFCINYSYHGGGFGKALSNYTLDLTAGTITLEEPNFNNTEVGVNYTYSTPITLANIRVINSTVRLFNRTVNLTSLNESGFTWLNNTNLTLANDDLTGLLKIYNCSGNGSHYGEIGSGNWTEFSADGKIFMTSNATFNDGLAVCINYSYWGSGYGSEVPDSNYSIDYLSGNLSILDSKWNLTLGINYSYHFDSTEKNKRECYNGTDWILLDTESDQDELFDIRMFWLLSGSEWDIDYYRVSPIGITDVDYFPSTSTSVLFNITANLTRSAGNQTTVNVSLWIRIDNSSGIYTQNSSNFVLINESFVNQTLIFADGERIWYYWAFEDNQSRSIENTTVRIVDILPDLEIMSIGDETKPINFTLSGANAGDAVFKGTVTAANLISLAGFTGQLNATSCNLTISSGIITGFAGCGIS